MPRMMTKPADPGLAATLPSPASGGGLGRGLHGWLVIDKPEGITSARVVAQIKRATGAKVGHAGTLDPLATGVLPLALGEATKTVQFAASGGQRYCFRIRWGEARDTEDRDGAVTAQSPVRPDPAAILAALPRFTGPGLDGKRGGPLASRSARDAAGPRRAGASCSHRGRRDRRRPARSVACRFGADRGWRPPPGAHHQSLKEPNRCRSLPSANRR